MLFVWNPLKWDCMFNFDCFVDFLTCVLVWGVLLVFVSKHGNHIGEEEGYHSKYCLDINKCGSIQLKYVNKKNPV